MRKPMHVGLPLSIRKSISSTQKLMKVAYGCLHTLRYTIMVLFVNKQRIEQLVQKLLYVGLPLSIRKPTSLIRWRQVDNSLILEQSKESSVVSRHSLGFVNEEQRINNKAGTERIFIIMCMARLFDDRKKQSLQADSPKLKRQSRRM